MKNRLFLSLNLWLWLLAGCASLNSGQPGQPNYAADAEQNLRLGNEALEDGNFLEAQQYFEHVRTKYPFAEAAKEAELKLAETEFRRERWSESRDLYRNFVKLHPTHQKVDVAAFQAAMSHYREIPSDFFVVPPSHEKDQTQVLAALAAFNDFVRQYPGSEFVPEANKLIADVRKRLAQHEMYAAEFYTRRKRWAAVAGRLEKLVTSYGGTGLDERAYFELHDAYLRLDQPEKAKETLRRVVEKMPGTNAAKRAQKLLGS